MQFNKKNKVTKKELQEQIVHYKTLCENHMEGINKLVAKLVQEVAKTKDKREKTKLKKKYIDFLETLIQPLDKDKYIIKQWFIPVPKKRK